MVARRADTYEIQSSYLRTSVKETGSSSLLVMQGGELAEAPGRWNGIER
jgi:hypothetical protein